MEQMKDCPAAATLTLEQVRDSILAHVAQGHASEYRIGQLYNQAVEERLAERSGFRDFPEFFRQHGHTLPPSSLSLYGDVCQRFSQPICVAHGMKKLGVLLALEKLAGVELPEGDPGPVLLEVPRVYGPVRQLRFADCTLEEVKWSLKHQCKRARALVSHKDSARVRALRESLARYCTQSGAMHVSARVHHGRTLVNVQDVPLTELEQFARAILAGLEPLRAAG